MPRTGRLYGLIAHSLLPVGPFGPERGCRLTWGGQRSIRRIRDLSERVYEILFIADPNLGEPEVEALTATVQGFVEKEGGTIQKVEKWGKKRLAYIVGKHREGYVRAAGGRGRPRW